MIYMHKSESMEKLHLKHRNRVKFMYLNTFSKIKTRIIKSNKTFQKHGEESSTTGLIRIQSESKPPERSVASRITAQFHQQKYIKAITLYCNKLTIKNCAINKNKFQKLLTDEHLSKEDCGFDESMSSDTSSENARKGTNFVTRGNSRYNEHRFSEALEDFEEALALEPLDRQANLGRARVLLHNGEVDEAEHIAQNILNEDIWDQDAHEFLRQVALRKFRGLLAMSASSVSTPISLIKAINKCTEGQKSLSNEEVMFAYMKVWCDRMENRGSISISIPNAVLLHTIGSVFFRNQEFILGLTCFYIVYGSYLFNPKDEYAKNIGERDILNLLCCIAIFHIYNGTYDAARIVLSIAQAQGSNDLEAGLKMKLLMCMIQLETGELEEPLQLLEEVRKEAETCGIKQFAFTADLLISCTQRSIGLFESALDSSDRIRRALSDPKLALFKDAALTELEITSIAKELIPNESEGMQEKAELMAKRLTLDQITHGVDYKFIEAFQAYMEAERSSYQEANSDNTRKLYERALSLYEALAEDAHKLHKISTELVYEPFCAFLQHVLGNTEESNRRFTRCLNLAKSLNHERTGYICLYYTIALVKQRNFKEAFIISLEGETNFLKLYNKTTFEELRIIINQEICFFRSYQLIIFLGQFEWVKALYVLERNLMPALRKDNQLPLDPNELEQRSNDLLSELKTFSKDNASILIYLNHDRMNCLNYWVILPDYYYYLNFETDENLISAEKTDNTIDESKYLLMPLIGNDFRKFPKQNTSNSEKKDNKQLKYIRKRLWDFLKYYLTLFKEAKRIIIIPELRLNLIPYALLGNTSASDNQNDYPLLKTLPISISPSFWALSPTYKKSQRPLRPTKQCPVALLIGNPENNLPAAEEEVSIAAHTLERCKELKVLSLTQDSATRHIVLDSLVDSSVVHIASHGNLSADENHIRAGAIQLADGTLFAKQIEVRSV